MSALRAVPADRHVPHDMEAEQAVLGACLLDREVIVRLQGQLEGADFYRSTHATIWQAMLGLLTKRTPIDLLTLTGEMRRNGTLEDAGGETYLSELMVATPTASHAEYYAGTVKEASIRRRLIHAANSIATVAWDESMPMDDVVAQADEAITTAARVRMRDGYRAVGDIASEVWERMGSGETRLIPFGLGPLDAFVGGCQPGQMVTIAARPGMGKTAIAIQVSNHQARQRRPVGFITLEMTDADVTERLIGLNSGANMHRYRRGLEIPDDLSQAVSRAFGTASELPLYIDDRSSGMLHDVLNRARTMHAERGIEFLVIDYVQLMGSGGSKRNQNRTQELTEITRALKVLALELRIVVLALAQLNRDVEKRNPPVPMLSDLRDSGSFEQDSDIVLFINRMDHYGKGDPGIADLIVAKHRNGPVGVASMIFREHTLDFVRMDNH